MQWVILMQRLEQRHLELLRQVNKYLQSRHTDEVELKSLAKRVSRLKKYYEDCPIVHFASAWLNSAQSNPEMAVDDAERGFRYRTIEQWDKPENRWEIPDDIAYAEDALKNLYAENIILNVDSGLERFNKALGIYKELLHGKNSNKQQLLARISTTHALLGNNRMAMAYLKNAVQVKPVKYTDSNVLDIAFSVALGSTLDLEGESAINGLHSLYLTALNLRNPHQYMRSQFLTTLGDVYSDAEDFLTAGICYYRSLEGILEPVDSDKHIEKKLKATNHLLEGAKMEMLSDEPNPVTAKKLLGLLLEIAFYRGQHTEYSRYFCAKREEAYELLAAIDPENKDHYYRGANLETLLMKGERLDHALRKVRIDPFVAMPVP